MENRKQQAIREILDRNGLQALLITDPYNMRYLSGFRGGEGMLFLSREQEVLITDSRYTEAAAKESEFTLVEEGTAHSRTQILQELLRKEGMVQRIGYEDQHLRCSELAAWRNSLSSMLEWKGVGNKVTALRAIKDEEELSYLARAEAIGDEAFTDILNVLRPGITEKQVAAELEYRMKQHGAEGISFETIVASGVHSSMPHAVPTDKPIEAGDFVTMDFGCRFEGYCSDMTRTVVVGKANDRQKEIYDIVLEAQEACLRNLRAGLTGKEADAYARDVIRAAGYAERFGHGTGHSVGLEIHEDPRLSQRDETVLRPGMVVTVEPGIYLPGFGGVRIEDMVVITETGCRNLASSPK